MLDRLLSFFRPPRRQPTAFELVAERVRAARLEAARLAAYAAVGRERLRELEASERLWRRRAELARERGLAELAEAAKQAADEDAERVAEGELTLAELEGDADAAQDLVDDMLGELERLSVLAVGEGARLPVVEIDDAAAAERARAEAQEAGLLDGLDDAMERDFLTRSFEALEIAAKGETGYSGNCKRNAGWSEALERRALSSARAPH